MTLANMNQIVTTLSSPKMISTRKVAPVVSLMMEMVAKSVKKLNTFNVEVVNLTSLKSLIRLSKSKEVFLPHHQLVNSRSPSR